MDYPNDREGANGASLAYVDADLAPVDEVCGRMASAKLDSVASTASALPEDLSYQYWSSCW